MKMDNANRLADPKTYICQVSMHLTENRNNLLKFQNQNGRRSLVFGLTRKRTMPKYLQTTQPIYTRLQVNTENKSQTVQRHGVCSVVYGTVHYKELLLSQSVGHSPDFSLPSVTILP